MIFILFIQRLDLSDVFNISINISIRRMAIHMETFIRLDKISSNMRNIKY